MGTFDSHPLYANFQQDAEGNRTYKVTHQVLTSDKLDGPRSVALSMGIDYTTSYSFGNEVDAGAYFTGGLSSLFVEDQGARKKYRVEVEYSTKAKKRCDEVQIDDPLLIPPDISGDFAQFQKPFIKDKDGRPYLNSSRQPFVDVPKDDSRPTLKIKKNFASISLAQFVEYADAVNSDTFFGLPERIWKMQRIAWSRAFLGSCGPYYPVELEMHANWETWDFSEVDRGFYELVTDGSGSGSISVSGVSDCSGDKRVLITDARGHPLNEASPLDGAGKALGPCAELVYIEARGYRELPYAALGIPTSL